MGRRRTRDFDLPPRMQRKGKAFYYVTNGPRRRWIPLGSDLNRARRLWADLECRSLGEATVASLIEIYLADCGDEWAASTRRQYKAFGKTLSDAFGELAPDALTAPRIARWRDDNRHRKIWINGCLSLLRSAISKAVEWGMCRQNIAREVAGFDPNERDRYVEDHEFVAIRAKAPTWLRDAMDISYLTTLRESDVLALRWESVNEFLSVRQVKTKARQAFVIPDELREVLERCKAKPVVGLFVIANQKGRPIKARRLQEAFAAARIAAGVEDVIFHDIRAKGGTDAKADGLNYQAMLGHKNARTSERYIRRRETPIVQPLRRKL